MRFWKGIPAVILVMILCISAGCAEPAGAEHPVVVLRIADYGDIYLELYPEYAPETVENFLGLVDSGYYNGLTFHRIISGFMAQGGCPLGNGRDRSRHRNAQAAFGFFQRFHQHAARIPAEAGLPVLRNAAGGCDPRPEQGRQHQRALLPMVLRGWNLYLQ